MDAINLYVLCQGTDLENYSDYQNTLTKSDKKISVKKDEIITLNTFVKELYSRGVKLNGMDNFFFGFTIPQISKEFDLLKIYEDGPVINIELKSRMVEYDKIEYQLKKNQYYLSHLEKEIYSFTYLTTEIGTKVYSYDGKILKESSIDDIISVIQQEGKCFNANIEKLFRAKDYLISPINTPQLFLNGNYYLTAQQDSIKNKILKSIDANEQIMWGITGGAGTGKTLLLYDIARELSKDKKVCIVHSGILASGHVFISGQMKNVDIISAKSCFLEKILGYECILVDEAQRIHQDNFNYIIEAFEKNKRKCIFSYDFYQVLSRVEERRNIPDQLRNKSYFHEEHITEKIRTNREIASFIKNVINLADRPKQHMNYDCVEVLYAKNYDCASTIIEHYVHNKEYEFIAYTPSRVSSVLDRFRGYMNTHRVIGQEFDNVIFNMDDNFRYTQDGHLQGKFHPNPDYIFYKLWFQGVSRARERLCILVIGNEDLFEKLLLVKNQFKQN